MANRDTAAKNLDMLDDFRRAGEPATLWHNPDTDGYELIPTYVAEARRIFRDRELARKRELEEAGGEMGLFLKNMGCRQRKCTVAWQRNLRDCGIDVRHNDDTTFLEDRVVWQSGDEDYFRTLAFWIAGLHERADEIERDKLIYETGGA